MHMVSETQVSAVMAVDSETIVATAEQDISSLLTATPGLENEAVEYGTEQIKTPTSMS